MSVGPITRLRIYHSAIANEDGSVNVAYLVLFRLLQFDSALSLLMVAGGFVMQYFSATHEYPFGGVATAVGSIWGTFSAALAAMGAFLWADAKTTTRPVGTQGVMSIAEEDHASTK